MFSSRTNRRIRTKVKINAKNELKHCFASHAKSFYYPTRCKSIYYYLAPNRFNFPVIPLYSGNNLGERSLKIPAFHCIWYVGNAFRIRVNIFHFPHLSVAGLNSPRKCHLHLFTYTHVYFSGVEYGFVNWYSAAYNQQPVDRKMLEKFTCCENCCGSPKNTTKPLTKGHFKI